MSIQENAYIWATDGRSSFHAYVFLKEVLKFCENKPEITVDRGFWYKWALQRLGLKYKHETFGERNAVEGFFSLLKRRTKTGIDSPPELLLIPFRVGSRALSGFIIWRCYFDSVYRIQ